MSPGRLDSDCILKSRLPQPLHAHFHCPRRNRYHIQIQRPHLCVVRGDGIYASIAAASILAKTYRDDYMKQIAVGHPEYDWLSNKGYPTSKHRAAVLKHGFTPYHRVTFRVTADPEI